MPPPQFLSHALIIRALVILAALALVLKQFGIYPASPSGADWIGLIAPLFFLAAFWFGAAIFTPNGDRSEFGPALITGLNRMGAGLMLGAWAAILAEPALRHLAQNGFTTMNGVHFDLSLANLALVFAGLILILIARRGRQLRADLDGFV